MSALRLARAATGRDLVVKFAGGYHGHATACSSRPDPGVATPGDPGQRRRPASRRRRRRSCCRSTTAAAVTAAFAAHAGRIAAVIVEPVGGQRRRHPAAARLPRAPARARRARDGALLIFDEVITGFRVGRGGAQARFGVAPDLTTLGKIIGGGMPIGAYGGRRRPDGPRRARRAGLPGGHAVRTPAVDGRRDRDARRADAAALRASSRRRGATPRGAASRTPPREAGATVAIARVGSLLTVFFRPSRAASTPPRRSTSDRAAFARFFGVDARPGVLLPPSPFEAWFLSMAHGARRDRRDARRPPRPAFAAMAAA